MIIKLQFMASGDKMFTFLHTAESHVLVTTDQKGEVETVCCPELKD